MRLLLEVFLALPRVKKYDKDAKTLDVYINSGKFTDPGETIVGSTSNATHTVSSFNDDPGVEMSSLKIRRLKI